MVKLNKIYTRGGDGGESSLVDGSRLPKDAPVFEAIGAVDEVGTAIGMARNGASAKTAEVLSYIQNDLFDLGADLATPFDGAKSEGALRITEAQVARLEKEIDEIGNELKDLTSFVLPGGTPSASALHVARTITRRAERCVVTMQNENKINPEAIKYLNRLSDLLFQLSRFENNGGADDVLWKPGGEIS
ncbi:MAG: cob(I)yrinic acid a,c-diamide adenosyltransferase [Rhodospirillaceae bacterium]|nr:cob(I)yrinic acid a,c-diamide adenosyltransferase [Rhodospirillaceae bacterium]